MPSTTPFPSESKSQRIGQNAKIAFQALTPTSWRAENLSGDEDVGLDYHVQVVENGEYRYAFHVQLKGSETPQISQTRESIVVRLKSATINYYQNITEPVMLVVCDLSTDKNPRNAAGHYVWIHEQLNLLTQDAEYVDDTQQSHAIHVPFENTFDPCLDVSGYCIEHVRRTRASEGIYDAISGVANEDASLEPVGSVDRLAMRIRHGGHSFLEPILTESSTPWVKPPEGSIADILSTAAEHLRKSDDHNAGELLERVSNKLSTLSPQEQAEYQYLLGSIYSLRGSSGVAQNCFKRAHKLYSNEPKYVVSWIQEQIRRIPSEKYRRNCCRFLKLLPNSDRREVVCLKSKLLVIVGNYEEAIDLLKVLPKERKHVSVALIHTIREQWSLVRQVCEEGLEDANLPQRHRAILRILTGRAIFQLMLKDHQNTSGEWWVPLTGPTGVNPKLLNECWVECEKALTLLRNDGWPLEVEHLAEFLPIPAVALNHHRSILEDIRRAALKRPHLVALQACLERLAFASGKIAVALEAMDRQPASKLLSRHKAYLCWIAGQKQRALDIARSEIHERPDTAEQLDPQLLVIGAASAHDLLESEQEAEFVSLLQSTTDWAGELAVFRYISETSDAPLGRDKALRKLLDAFESFPDCEFLQGTLLRQLDTRNKESAQYFIGLVKQIREHRELELSDIVRLAEAHFTLENWHELTLLADDALVRFGQRDQLVSIKALALECSGESIAALAMLEPLVKKGNQEQLALDVYINIAVRCGFVTEALATILRMLEREQEPAGRRELLRLLFLVKMTSNAPSQELYIIAWRYGQLASKVDEVQEGIFLNLYLMATLHTSVRIEEAHSREFQERLNAYSSLFPESKVIRTIPVPEMITPSEFIYQLEKVAGLDRERKRNLEKIVNDLHHQRVAVPFSWRPRNIFVNVSNVFQLWETAKNTNKDAKEYHLMMFAEEDPKQRNLGKLGAIPLLDMLSLIVANDLDLWEVLFKIFDKIAVAKSTLVELQKLCVPMLGLGFVNIARDIMEHLKTNMDCIVQPGAPHLVQITEKNEEIESIQEMIELVGTGAFVAYCDDAYIRTYVDTEVDEIKSICTFDLLQEAETRGYLSTREVALRISKLVGWNVIGVPVSVGHFLCVFPSSIDSTDDPVEISDLIRWSSFGDMAESLWDYKCAYVQVTNHVAQVLAYMCRQPTINAGLMPALWRLWLDKVRLRADAPAKPIQHLARSMALAGAKLKDADQSSAKSLWNAYKRVVELEFGEEMDEQKETHSIELVGRTLAEMVGKDLDSINAERLLRNLRNGFVPGTAEYCCFVEAYENERLRDRAGISKVAPQ